MGTMSVGHKHTQLYATLKVNPEPTTLAQKGTLLRKTTTAIVWKQLITHHCRKTLKAFQCCQGQYIISLQAQVIHY